MGGPAPPPDPPLVRSSMVLRSLVLLVNTGPAPAEDDSRLLLRTQRLLLRRRLLLRLIGRAQAGAMGLAGLAGQVGGCARMSSKGGDVSGAQAGSNIRERRRCAGSEMREARSWGEARG